MKNLLVIHSSPRAASVSNNLANQLVEKLKTLHPNLNVKTRNISASLPFVSEEMVNAFYTPSENRTAEQKESVKLSDELVDELFASDGLIIAVPMWNFTMPAAMKAYFDLIVRVGRTFKFKETGGFDSLLTDRKTYLVVATGGVPVGTPMDMLTPAIKTILGFIGIQSVEIIAAEGTNMPNSADKIHQAEEIIKKLAA
jgi:FMN-dependent NADH-azoreductase